MTLIKLTPENAQNYIDRNVIFKTRRKHIVKKIIGVSYTGKTVYIEHSDLGNQIQIVTRVVHVLENN
jgi:hypothetical protein